MKALLACLLALAVPVNAATLTATGNWSQSLTAANLTAGAGTNFVSPLSSASDVIIIDITGSVPPVSEAYSVYVRLVNISAPAGAASISVRRTSAGTGVGTISGGTGYLTPTSSDTLMFTGTFDRSAIAIQVRVTGLGVFRYSPGTYQVNLLFTVTP